MRIMAIDYGDARTGVAISDALGWMTGQTTVIHSWKPEKTAEEVARFTGIPKHMLQTGKESYDSNAQQRQNYVTDTLLPYVVQWEQEDGYKAIPPDKRDGEGWYMRGNVAVLLRGDALTRSQVYERMIRTSVYNPDECRAMEEKAPIPGGLGQQFLATKNLASLEAVLKGEK